MGWFVGLICVVGFAWLMFANEQFRRFGFGLIGLIVAGGTLLWFLQENGNRERDAARERSLSAIPISQLTFTNMQLADQGYGWRLSGNLFNRSAHSIRAVTIRVLLQECTSAAAPQRCITTGQDDAHFYVEIPAGQARQLDTSLQLENAANLGTGWSWRYVVLEVEANLDASR